MGARRKKLFSIKPATVAFAAAGLVIMGAGGAAITEGVHEIQEHSTLDAQFKDLATDVANTAAPPGTLTQQSMSTDSLSAVFQLAGDKADGFTAGKNYEIDVQCENQGRLECWVTNLKASPAVG